MISRKTKQIIILLLILSIFIATSYFSKTITDTLQMYISQYNTLGMLIYVFALIIATVLGPITLLPVLPIAVELWGPFASAMLNNLGWTIGGMIAFSLSRKYGRDLIKRFVDLKQIEWVENKIPKNHLFLTVIILRIAIPIDFVSYALGLFTNMKLAKYTIATFIGTIPPTLALAYAVKLPISLQISTIIIGLLILWWGYKFTQKHKTFTTTSDPVLNGSNSDNQH